MFYNVLTSAKFSNVQLRQKFSFHFGELMAILYRWSVLKSQQTECFIVFIVRFQLHMEKKLLNSLNENNNAERHVLEFLPYWTLVFKHLFLPADWTLPYVLHQ